MVLQKYQNLIEMTSNIIDIVAFGVGFKCPRKIHLNTQCHGEDIMISWTSLAIDSKFIEVLEIPFSKVVFYFKIFVSQVKKKVSLR